MKKNNYRPPFKIWRGKHRNKPLLRSLKNMAKCPGDAAEALEKLRATILERLQAIDALRKM